MATGKFAALADFKPTRKKFQPREGFGGATRVGKRSNPDYHQYSIILSKESWSHAQTLLHGKEFPEFQWRTGRPDFSGLIQQLLDKWLEEQK